MVADVIAGMVVEVEAEGLNGVPAGIDLHEKGVVAEETLMVHARAEVAQEAELAGDGGLEALDLVAGELGGRRTASLRPLDVGRWAFERRLIQLPFTLWAPTFENA